MIVAGLTGGIATGKSTVGRWFEEWGGYVVDADRLAHEVMAPGGPAYDGVVAEFGEAILGGDLRIDRGRLANEVFDNPALLQRLNALVHPHVRNEARARFHVHGQREPNGVGVFEAALLVETGAHREMDRLVVTHCRPETQIERLLARGLDRREAERRLAAQLPGDAKRAVADYPIDTEASIDETRAAAREVWARLTAEAAAS